MERHSLVTVVVALFVVILCSGVVVREAESINIQDELRITLQQKVALDKLRQRIAPQLPENWMKEDLFLIRWLRSTKFDVNEAHKRILENVKWRKQNKLNGILSEDFSDIADEYPYVFTSDKQGQPVFIGFAGEWDLRNAVLTGRAPRVIRYMVKAMEAGQKKLRKMQLEGYNVTRLNLLIDLDGFNIPQHGCVQCLFRILDFLAVYDKNYPGFADKVIFFNAPPTVAVALDLIRTNANSETWKAIKTYPRDKNVWFKALLSFIDRKEIPRELGGLKDRSTMATDSDLTLLK